MCIYYKIVEESEDESHSGFRTDNEIINETETSMVVLVCKLA